MEAFLRSKYPESDRVDIAVKWYMIRSSDYYFAFVIPFAEDPTIEILKKFELYLDNKDCGAGRGLFQEIVWVIEDRCPICGCGNIFEEEDGSKYHDHFPSCPKARVDEIDLYEPTVSTRS